MATNLIDTVKEYLTPDIMQKISSIIGETPGTAQKGLDSVIPALLARMADLSSSADGASQLSNLMDKATNNGNLLSNLPGQLSGGTATQTLLNTGSSILSTLFGDRLNSVISAITSALGTGSASVSSLMKIAAPLILSILAKERTARGMGTAGLASLLAEQKGSLVDYCPQDWRVRSGWAAEHFDSQPGSIQPRMKVVAMTSGGYGRLWDWSLSRC